MSGVSRKFGGGKSATGTPSLAWSSVVVVSSLLAGASIVHNIYKPNLTLPPAESVGDGSGTKQDTVKPDGSPDHSGSIRGEIFARILKHPLIEPLRSGPDKSNRMDGNESSGLSRSGEELNPHLYYPFYYSTVMKHVDNCIDVLNSTFNFGISVPVGAETVPNSAMFITVFSLKLGDVSNFSGLMIY